MPPPHYLFRSERHSDPFPRFKDENTVELVSSIASDVHAWVESAGQCEIPISLSCPDDDDATRSELVDGVEKHLKKTQMNKGRAARNEELHFSQLLSLSGCFHWAVHTICLKGRSATKGQEAGLAIFKQ